MVTEMFTKMIRNRWIRRVGATACVVCVAKFSPLLTTYAIVHYAHRVGQLDAAFHQSSKTYVECDLFGVHRTREFSTSTEYLNFVAERSMWSIYALTFLLVVTVYRMIERNDVFTITQIIKNDKKLD